MRCCAQPGTALARVSQAATTAQIKGQAQRMMDRRVSGRPAPAPHLEGSPSNLACVLATCGVCATGDAAKEQRWLKGSSYADGSAQWWGRLSATNRLSAAHSLQPPHSGSVKHFRPRNLGELCFYRTILLPLATCRDESVDGDRARGRHGFSAFGTAR